MGISAISVQYIRPSSYGYRSRINNVLGPSAETWRLYLVGGRAFYSRSSTILMFSFIFFLIESSNWPILCMSLELSIALIWSIIMSQSSFTLAVPLFRWILNMFDSGWTLVVTGQTTVEGWDLFSRSVWMITTSLTFPVSVPILGFKSAIQSSYCLTFITQRFKFS